LCCFACTDKRGLGGVARVPPPDGAPWGRRHYLQRSGGLPQHNLVRISCGVVASFLSDYLVLGGPVTQEACPRRCMKQTRPGISPTAISFLHVFLFASDEILFDFSRYDEHVMDEGKVYKVDIKLIFRIYAYYIVIKLLSSSSFQLLPM